MCFPFDRCNFTLLSPFREEIFPKLCAASTMHATHMQNAGAMIFALQRKFSSKLPFSNNFFAHLQFAVLTLTRTGVRFLAPPSARPSSLPPEPKCTSSTPDRLHSTVTTFKPSQRLLRPKNALQ